MKAKIKLAAFISLDIDISSFNWVALRKSCEQKICDVDDQPMTAQ